MSLQDAGPCTFWWASLPALNAILNALQLALVTWLVQKRAAADGRENGRAHSKMDQRSIDSGPTK